MIHTMIQKLITRKILIILVVAMTVFLVSAFTFNVTQVVANEEQAMNVPEEQDTVVSEEQGMNVLEEQAMDAPDEESLTPNPPNISLAGIYNPNQIGNIGFATVSVSHYSTVPVGAPSIIKHSLELTEVSTGKVITIDPAEYGYQTPHLFYMDRLELETEYTLIAYSHNDNGKSEPSNEITFTTPKRFGKPVIQGAIVQYDHVSAEIIIAGSNLNYDIVSSYNVRDVTNEYLEEGLEIKNRLNAITREREFYLTTGNLEAGTTYQFEIQAVNEKAVSEWSNSKSYTHGVAPKIVSIESIYGGIAVTIEPITQVKGSDTVSFAVEVKGRDDSKYNRQETLMADVEILENGNYRLQYSATEYTFETNVDYRIIASSELGSVTTNGKTIIQPIPENPTIPVAKYIGDNRMQLQFPKSEYDYTYRSYNLSIYSEEDGYIGTIENLSESLGEIDGATRYRVVFDGHNLDSQFTFEQGKIYWVEAQRRNKSGNLSTEKAKSNEVEIIERPSRVQNFELDQLYNAIKYRFTPPDTDGGSPIQKYIVEIVKNYSVIKTLEIEASELTSDWFYVKALDINTNYTIRVKAYNGYLESLVAAQAISTTDLPEAPLVTTEGGFGRLTVNIESTEKIDNHTVSGFELELKDSNDELRNYTLTLDDLTITPIGEASNTYTYVIDHLSSKLSYQLKAAAILDIGVLNEQILTKQHFNYINAAPIYGLPDAPTVTVVNNEANQATLTIEKPVHTGNAEVVAYEITYKNITDNTLAKSINYALTEEELTQETVSVVIDELIHGKEYEFEVYTVVKISGSDTHSTDSAKAQVTVLGAPTAPTITVTGKELSLQIEIDKPDDIEQISQYRIGYKKSSDTNYTYEDFLVDSLTLVDGVYTLSINNLEKNTVYEVVVKATNSSEFSTESSAVTATVLGMPDAAEIIVPPPFIKQAEVYDDEGNAGYGFLVYFKVPDNTGGSAIEQVRITTYKANDEFSELSFDTTVEVPINELIDRTGGTYSYIIESLAPNTYYEYEVELKNRVGYSEKSTRSNKVKMSGPASAPTEVNAVSVGNNSVQLTITPSSELNGATLSGYEVVEYKKINGELVATGETYQVSHTNIGTDALLYIINLELDDIYTFEVKTVSHFVKEGVNVNATTTAFTVSNEVVVVNEPHQPTITSVLGFDNMITIKIAPTTDTSISSYTYNITNEADEEIVGQTITKNNFKYDEDSNIVFEVVGQGILPLNNYTINIFASNSIGDSTIRTASAFTYERPSEPTITDVSLTDIGELTLQFAEPESDGGEPITHYSLKVFKDSNEIDVISIPVNQLTTGETAGTYNYILDALEAERYSFQLAASHQYGQSHYSVTSTPVHVYIAPEAPTKVTAIAKGNNAIEIDVTLGQLGGGELAVYGVEVHDADNEEWLEELDVLINPDELTDGKFVIAGLEKNKNYMFKVWVKNNAPLEDKQGEIGIWSPQATSSNTVLVQGIPDAPTSVNSVAGIRGATISFTAPANNGGSVITEYRVMNGETVVASSSTTSITLSNLEDDTTYNYTLVAINKNGVSTEVNIPSFTTAAAPEAVTGLSVSTNAANSVTVTFNKAAAATDNPVTGYTVHALKDGNIEKTLTLQDLTADNVVNTYTGTFTGLVKNTNYTFEVIAINAVGESIVVTSDEILVKGTPDAPQSVTLTPGNQELSVTITAPINDGGSPLTAYEITVYDENDDEVDTDSYLVSGTEDATFSTTGFSKNVQYKVVVVAINEYGTSVNDTVSNTVTVYGTPDAPTDVIATAIPGGASLTFNIPNDNSAAITHYIVTTHDDVSKTFTTNSGDFTGLIAHREYSFTVVAVNAAGESIASDPSNTITVLPRPASGGGGLPLPIEDKVESNNGEIELDEGQDGVMTLNDEITLSIPKGAFNNRLSVTIERLTELTGINFADSTRLSPVYELLKSVSSNFREPVTITLKYNAEQLMENEEPAIYYYDELKQEWIFIGGTYSNGKIEAKVDHFTKFAVFSVNNSEELIEEYDFSDISGHWAEADILRAVKLKIVTGYPDGTFKPKGTLTTSEFMTMLVRTLSLEQRADVNFADAEHIPTWALEAFEKAVYANILQGDVEDKLNPRAAVTRDELALYVARGLSLDLTEDVTLTFTDNESIPAWAASAIAQLNEMGIIKGRTDGQFDAAATLTRAEAITVILRLQAELANKK